MCNGMANLVSNGEEMHRGTGLNSLPQNEGSLIFPQAGQHKSCRSSSLNSSRPRVPPAWRWVNLRMLQVCFPFWPDAWGALDADGDAARPPAPQAACGRGAGSSPGQGSALPRPTARTLEIAQPTRGALGQVRAGVFKIMEQCGKTTRQGPLQRGRRLCSCLQFH